MPVGTTEGIIIKRSNFGEADRILTIVTPFKGKIRAIAKGVRRITSRRGGNVELLNKVKLQIFEGKGLPILTEAEALETFPKIKNDLLLSSYASYILELTERLLPEEEANPAVYHLLASILGLLEANPRQIFIRAYEVKLLSVLGFWSIKQINVSSELEKLLEKLQQGSWEEINEIKIGKEQALELERVLRYYIEKVLESSLRSVKIIQKLKDGK